MAVEAGLSVYVVGGQGVRLFVVLPNRCQPLRGWKTRPEKERRGRPNRHHSIPAPRERGLIQPKKACLYCHRNIITAPSDVSDILQKKTPHSGTTFSRTMPLFSRCGNCSFSHTSSFWNIITNVVRGAQSLLYFNFPLNHLFYFNDEGELLCAED